MLKYFSWNWVTWLSPLTDTMTHSLWQLFGFWNQKINTKANLTPIIKTSFFILLTSDSFSPTWTSALFMGLSKLRHDKYEQNYDFNDENRAFTKQVAIIFVTFNCFGTVWQWKKFFSITSLISRIAKIVHEFLRSSNLATLLMIIPNYFFSFVVSTCGFHLSSNGSKAQ